MANQKRTTSKLDYQIRQNLRNAVGVSRSVAAEELPRVSQVAEQTNRLGANLENLANAIAELENRVDPVLTPVLAERGSDKDEPDLVILATLLRERNQTLESLIGSLNSIISRIEL